MSFSMESEKENKLPLLDVEIIREQGIFPTSSIENLLLVTYIVTLKVFLPSVYKFGMVYTSVCRFFRLYSS